MVNFEPDKEIEKDVFCLVMSTSPHEESNLRPSDSTKNMTYYPKLIL